MAFSNQQQFGSGATAPDAPGVYALYQSGILIYIGSSTVSILDRLNSHYRGDEGPCTKAATHFAYEMCSDPVGKERMLLINYKMQNGGRLPRCNSVIP